MTLHSRLFALIAGLGVLIVLATSLLSAARLNGQLYAEFERRGRLAVKHLALDARDGVVVEDESALRQAVEITLDQPDVQFVDVRDAGGRPLFHLAKPGATAAAELLELAEPVRGEGGAVLGAVTAGISLHSIRDEQRRNLAQLALIMAAFLAAAGWLAHRFARSISRPIERMASTVQAITASNDLSRRVEVDVDIRELRLLANQLDQMFAELDAARGRLVENERMQKELEIAATIQTALLPRTEAINGAHYDLFAFMGPAEDVGGDYYDVIEGADGRLWVGIGDVSGHGLTAGLTMMMTQAAAATYVRACPEIGPRQLLAGVNGTLCENVRRFGTDDFFTACFLALEPTGRGVYSGRHLPLLAYRQEAGRCERIETRGVWLGVVPEVEDLLADDALALAPGDWLFLYTDGLIECRDAEGRLFDLERLEAAIARACSVHAGAEAAGRHVLAEVTRFMAGRPADDDMSLVVLRRR